MSGRQVSAAEFKAKCLRIIKEMQDTGESVTVTRRGRPVEPAIALDSVRLPGEFHADPADRFLIATARHWTAALVTADAAILEYSAAGHVPTIDAAR